MKEIIEQNLNAYDRGTEVARSERRMRKGSPYDGPDGRPGSAVFVLKKQLCTFASVEEGAVRVGSLTYATSSARGT